jgi:hypothetical protein
VPQLSGRGKAIVWVILTVALLAAIAAVFLTRIHRKRPVSLSLTGAVITQDEDPNKQLPIADVEITAAEGTLAVGSAKSDSSGLFGIRLQAGVNRGEQVTLRFRHREYQPLDLNEIVGDKLYVAPMVPIPHKTPSEPGRTETVVSNVTARYSLKATTELSVGSAVKTFQVANTGNVPCQGHAPCSPDGKWKAAIGSVTLEAGQGNAFRNARISCIAGPCPFTKIESDGFPQTGSTLRVSARNWSDTATFLVEAELVRPTVSDAVRDSYPVIFGQTLSFTLPAGAEGVSIQAEMNAVPIVYPLGPNLFLTWAECNAREDSEHTRVYRCVLKPGYRFL